MLSIRILFFPTLCGPLSRGIDMKFKMAQSNRQSGALSPSVKQEEGSPTSVSWCRVVQMGGNPSWTVPTSSLSLVCGLQLLRWSRLQSHGEVLQRAGPGWSMGLLWWVQQDWGNSATGLLNGGFGHAGTFFWALSSSVTGTYVSSKALCTE